LNKEQEEKWLLESKDPDEWIARSLSVKFLNRREKASLARKMPFSAKEISAARLKHPHWKNRMADAARSKVAEYIAETKKYRENRWSSGMYSVLLEQSESTAIDLAHLLKIPYTDIVNHRYFLKSFQMSHPLFDNTTVLELLEKNPHHVPEKQEVV